MKRYYLLAWFLPPILAVLTGALTLVLGEGQFDLGLTGESSCPATCPFPA